MLTLHYYSDAKCVRAAIKHVASAWWSQENDDDPVYSKDLIKEFDKEDPPLENELAWILSRGGWIPIFTQIVRGGVEGKKKNKSIQ